MKKPVISHSIDPSSAKPGARVPFFAKELDQEALRSIRAGDDGGDKKREIDIKLAQNG